MPQKPIRKVCSFPASSFSRGQIDQSLVDLIAANVRTPEITLGDMYAQAASLRLGGRRFKEKCDRYGLELVHAGIEAILDYGEEMTRKELAKQPKDVYEAMDYIDDDGVGNGPFKVCVKGTITDDEFVCDFRAARTLALSRMEAYLTVGSPYQALNRFLKRKKRLAGRSAKRRMK